MTNLTFILVRDDVGSVMFEVHSSQPKVRITNRAADGTVCSTYTLAIGEAREEWRLLRDHGGFRRAFN